ncbi:AlpA family phage regulatory protein [Burkholderia sp. R-69980]|uniref:helix-turn-helix transcriptional regulator n=1 Tax=Paraburkholderia domus TaxID=2793075 RepID=UPI00191292D4|nr:AlpA family phage regulatory protein [Paraburkholderia domus]MBK5119244.1 AlpA family phage regulatory protein [Burkholderia sp. R-69980]CAE6864631.1 hypothetical protein R75471_00424 [Paraburkholderia domus]
MTYPSRKIPSGAQCKTPRQTQDKFCRQKSWLWDKVKNDPSFPRPIYLGPHAPVFLEHELDAWLASRFDHNG